MSATSFQRQRRRAAAEAVLAFAETHSPRVVGLLLTEKLGIGIDDVEGFAEPARVFDLIGADDVDAQVAAIVDELAALDALNAPDGGKPDGEGKPDGTVTLEPAPGTVTTTSAPAAVAAQPVKTAAAAKAAKVKDKANG